MQKENKQFIELTNFWYNYVAQDHHKDKDCHFYVNQVFSYGQEPYWRIEHYGYIQELHKGLADTKYLSYEAAFNTLHTWLLDEVKDVIRFYKDYEPKPSLGGWDDYNHEGVKKLANKNLHIIDYEI